jgi:hypothetical protein
MRLAHKERVRMSPKEEEQRVNEQVLSAAARGDFTPFVNVLDDDVEVFDHVAYLRG